MPEINFYKIPDNHDLSAIVPASPKRDWMDATPKRFAYRCIPMTVANSTGWEVKSPIAFEATWDGGIPVESIQLKEIGDGNYLNNFVSSHFGSGILTFHTGFLVSTTPGWGIWVRGEPNSHKPGIVPLEGFVESDWLPFTFTMNWRFTEPGTIRFEREDTYCFITMMQYKELSNISASVKDLSDNPVLFEEYLTWANLREDFNNKLSSNDEVIVKKGWQKFYARGTSPGLITANENHTTKRIMKKPE